jgi:predicted permease
MFVSWGTLPSLILQSFNGLSLRDFPLAPLALLTVSSVVSASAAWLAYRRRHPRERGLLAGAALGASQLAALPLAVITMGPAGLRAALLCTAANSLAVGAASFMLFASAGPAFPEAFKHLDGGFYSGEWKGMLKDGYGRYTYPSGAKYEGEWKDGVKEGRGVYRFSNGGVYEGEWREGVQDGLGVRTYASGRVQAGNWRAGKLAAPAEDRLCAMAVEGANEAATIARKVRVGGGTPSDAAVAVARDVGLWAAALAAALAAAGWVLPPTVDAVTGQLAAAHFPLSLIAFGASLDLRPPETRQVGDRGRVLQCYCVMYYVLKRLFFLFLFVWEREKNGLV